MAVNVLSIEFVFGFVLSWTHKRGTVKDLTPEVTLTYSDCCSSTLSANVLYPYIYSQIHSGCRDFRKQPNMWN